MSSLLSRVKGFFGRRMEHGATMVEYGLMIALIAIALISTVKVLSDGISEVFDEAAVEMKAAIP